MNSSNYIKIGEGRVDACLDVVLYEEEGVFYVYAPALELCGYDTTEEGAKNSFETVFQEYLKYGVENGTLQDDLKEHGWHLRKSMEFDSPQFLVVLRHNKQLQGVINNDYTKVSRNFSYSVC